MRHRHLDDYEFLNAIDHRRVSPVIDEACIRLERMLKLAENAEIGKDKPVELPLACPVCDANLANYSEQHE